MMKPRSVECQNDLKIKQLKNYIRGMEASDNLIFELILLNATGSWSTHFRDVKLF